MIPGILRPSSAERWASPCAGSFAMEQAHPEPDDSPKAREGTAAHFYVTEAVQGRVHPIGTVTPNGHPIDAEMVEAGQCYVDDVTEARALMGVTNPVAWGVEQRLTMHGLIHPDCEGTPDTYLLDLPGKLLIVSDYKYGHGYVEPFRNKQGIAYIAGVFEAYELTLADVVDLRIEFRVVQPRNYEPGGPIRTWRTTGAEVWPLIEQLAHAAFAAKTPGAPTVTGDQCDYCSAAHACQALKRAGGRAMDLAASSTPDPLPLDALGLELALIDRAMRRLEARRDALSEVAFAHLRGGGRLPGWAITHGQAREQWSVPDAEVHALGDMLGADLRKLSSVTPNQARKLLDAGVIDAYSTRPTGKAKLTPVDDNQAAKVFGAAPPQEPNL